MMETTMIRFMNLPKKEKILLINVCRCGSHNLSMIGKDVFCLSCDLQGTIIEYTTDGPRIKWNNWCIEDLKDGQHLFRFEERAINDVIKEKCVKCSMIYYTV